MSDIPDIEILSPSLPSREERTYAMMVHFSAFVGFLIPLFNMVAPLIIWLWKREDYPLVNTCGRESLNFQLSTTLYIFVSLFFIFKFIGFVIIFMVSIFWFLCVLKAGLKANAGISYHYPLTIRFIKEKF